MKRTWLSLFYETGYLLCCRRPFAGRAGHRIQPAVQQYSNTSYGNVLPRLLGTVLLSIGAVFVQIVRMHIEELYTTTIAVRVPLIAVNLWLFSYSGNPLFLTLFVIVSPGFRCDPTRVEAVRKIMNESLEDGRGPQPRIRK